MTGQWIEVERGRPVGACGSLTRTIADTQVPPSVGPRFLVSEIVCTTASERSAHIWLSVLVVMSSGEK